MAHIYSVYTYVYFCWLYTDMYITHHT